MPSGTELTRESLESALAELEEQARGIVDGSRQGDAIALGIDHAVQHLRRHFFGRWIRLGDGKLPPRQS